MELNDGNLEEFARKCAAAYCKRFSNWNQLDDAQQDAAVFLLANRDKWHKPAPVLFRRTVGQLVRNYQEERKLRTKTPIRIVSGDVDRAAAKDETAAVDERLDSGGEPDPRWTIIERALRQPELTPAEREIVRAILRGDQSNDAIAATFHKSPGRISQIFSKFKTVCQRLDARPGVVSVDTKKIDSTPEERAANPLFFD